ncbi:MAG: hypothetical protein WKF70_07955 [Chitinophagaceae bacterium]
MVSINKIIQTKGIDLWEAWIDQQVLGSRTRTMLYVVGEVLVNKDRRPVLLKRNHQPQSSELHLELLGQGSHLQTEEIYYSEVVSHDYCPYTEVLIYSDNTLVATIEIESESEHYF